MHPSEIERLCSHLESAEHRHPVATIVTGNGATYVGDVTSFGLHALVVADPVSKHATKIQLSEAVSVRVVALGTPPVSFGDAVSDDETVVP